MDELLMVGDAARVLGLSTDMVRKLTRMGRLPAVRAHNGYHLFRSADLERLAAERARGKGTRASGRGRP